MLTYHCSVQALNSLLNFYQNVRYANANSDANANAKTNVISKNVEQFAGEKTGVMYI